VGKTSTSFTTAGVLLTPNGGLEIDKDSAAPVSINRQSNDGDLVVFYQAGTQEGTISVSFEVKELKTGVIRLAQGANVPVIPTIIWGSQRIWTKKVKRNLRRQGVPITVAFGEPLYFDKKSDVETGEKLLRETMLKMLHEVQEKYPDSHEGQRWAPVRLGGTAPAPLN
jgi:hypothetical protein